MDPTTLSRQLRTLETDDLKRRRALVALSNVGALAGIVVSLYQTGVLSHLPDLPGKIWNADKVDASDYAYKRFDTPDALMMTVSYGVTAWLAGAGGADRAERHPWLPVALAVKVLNDAAFAVKLGQEEWAENKALCWYCQSATLASLASVPLVIPEAVKGVRRILGRG
jgi:uncharacterized membrane protein